MHSLGVVAMYSRIKQDSEASIEISCTVSGLQEPGMKDLSSSHVPEPGEPVDMQDAPVSSTAAAHLLDKKQRQRLKAEGIELFNQKPKKGIALLQSHGLVSHDPVEVAYFLKQSAGGLDYAMMGDYLSDPSDTCKQVRALAPDLT